MAGNVKCILRCVAALFLLAGTALQAKNGDGGGCKKLDFHFLPLNPSKHSAGAGMQFRFTLAISCNCNTPWNRAALHRFRHP